MQEFINGAKYLITTDNYFYGADGEQYRAAWGAVEVIKATEALGFTPARSSNWFLKVGTDEGAVIIAGCQIHYAIQCSAMPKLRDGFYTDERTGQPFSNNCIYIAEQANTAAKTIAAVEPDEFGVDAWVIVDSTPLGSYYFSGYTALTEQDRNLNPHYPLKHWFTFDRDGSKALKFSSKSLAIAAADQLNNERAMLAPPFKVEPTPAEPVTVTANS